jgi:hypothetical protein
VKLLSSKKELNDCLFSIIEHSQDTLKIVSPYVDFVEFVNTVSRTSDDIESKQQKWEKMIKLLIEKKNILEIYTKPKSAKNESVDNIENSLKLFGNSIVTLDKLHAKIYMNDNTALLSSMNLTLWSFNHSIDFGVVTETEAEYRTVLDYCNKYIYCRKSIIDYLSKEGIDAKFESDSCLILEKNEDIIMRCYIDEFITPMGKQSGNFYIYIQIIKNRNDFIPEKTRCSIGEKYSAEIKWRSEQAEYYIHLKDKYPDKLIDTVLNNPEEKMREILTDIFNITVE